MARIRKIIRTTVIALLIASVIHPFSYAVDMDVRDRAGGLIAKPKNQIPIDTTAHAVTREQFFVELAKWLELDPLEIATVRFPDIGEADPQYLPWINALTEPGYVLGRTNGLLDPKGTITVDEMKLVYERIVLMRQQEPEVITKTVYVDGGTTYINVPTRMHGYIYDEARGYYYCPHCGETKPPGTGVYRSCNTTSAAITTTAGLYYDDFIVIDTMNGYIETFNTDPPLYGMLYSYIGYDADIYILTGDDELVPISFMEMIEMYAETGFYAIYYDVADPVPLPPGTDTDPLLLKIVVIAP